MGGFERLTFLIITRNSEKKFRRGKSDSFFWSLARNFLNENFKTRCLKLKCILKSQRYFLFLLFFFFRVAKLKCCERRILALTTMSSYHEVFHAIMCFLSQSIRVTRILFM